MYEDRDDTLPRASAVLGHFKRNITHDALTKLRDAFTNAWKSPVTITSPLDFEVGVDFGRVLPDDTKKAIESELTLHGWDNYILTTGNKDGVEQHVLVVKLNHAEASVYA